MLLRLRTDRVLRIQTSDCYKDYYRDCWTLGELYGHRIQSLTTFITVLATPIAFALCVVLGLPPFSPLFLPLDASGAHADLPIVLTIVHLDSTFHSIPPQWCVD
jgi:hypothetical protein